MVTDLPTEPAVPLIEFERVSKWYGEVIGLNDVSTTFQPGITGLLGPNGAGKSTLMGLLTGQLRPNLGHVRVFGQRPWDNPSVLARIGYCPEGDRFWSRMTGFAFVHFLARQSGLSGAEARDATCAAIEATQMTSNMHRPIATYSKGMRQRIKIAQTLVHRPALLVLDEPFTGADPVARHELSVLFRRLAEEGVSIVISSHVLHEVEALTRRILMIDRGRIVAAGDIHTVREGLADRPHAIRIRVDAPRKVAAAMVALDSVTGLRWLDAETLMVDARVPAEVHARLSEIVLQGGLVLRELATADESLEAVFEYLTERGR